MSHVVREHPLRLLLIEHTLHIALEARFIDAHDTISPVRVQGSVLGAGLRGAILDSRLFPLHALKNLKVPLHSGRCLQLTGGMCARVVPDLALKGRLLADKLLVLREGLLIRKDDASGAEGFFPMGQD